jgi:hypothetical protein
MGLLDAIKEIAEKIFTNGVLAPPEVANRRLKICNSCPYLLRRTRNCRKCACFVDAKTKYADQRCKLGKW